MAFYDLPRYERAVRTLEISGNIFNELKTQHLHQTLLYFADTDTYIRKVAYVETGKIYRLHRELRSILLQLLRQLLSDADFKVRQTAINAAGEIGKFDFEAVEHFFDIGLFDSHHSPRNAVIGSIKKMGEKNPGPVLAWCKKYLHHPDKEIRREICHGIELRGRTHPQDILPMLRELQWDTTKRVYTTLVHVIGQIAYKKGCLATVTETLLTWENKKLVAEAWVEILVIHDRYRNFSYLTTAEAQQYIEAATGITIDYQPQSK
jgi:hypothetical protein